MQFEDYKALVAKCTVGKRLPDAVYLHNSALAQLPDALQSFVSKIATAVKLAPDSWNILKLSRRDFKLSFLLYPDFDHYPYPALQESHLVDLTKLAVRSASYASSENPPILHRRELFIAYSDPRRSAFESFTHEGAAIDLYKNTSIIGTQKGWLRAIKRAGYQLDEEGHLTPLQLTKEAESVLDIDEVHRHKTAISRDRLSVPMFTLARGGYLSGDYSVLDYGCGKGDDIRELEAHEIDCIGWDPVHRPDTELSTCDVVNLGYVINVIECIDERRDTLRTAFSYSERLMSVAALIGNESVYEKFKAYKDGVITKSKTFQKYYYQAELKEFIESTLGEEAIAAGPGVFLVFKDKLEEQRYLSERQRTRLSWRQLSTRPTTSKSPRISQTKIEENAELLQDFWMSCLELGRIAANDEFECSDAIRQVFGSHQKALDICKDRFESNDLEHATAVRKDDLLVYLALDHFGKREPYSRMPLGLQRDIKYHFDNYNAARDLARELLFSVSDTETIWRACLKAKEILPACALFEDHNLVFQKDFLNQCPKELRIYIGCALQLYGDLDGINLIKAHIQSGKVTLMAYDGFETDPIPQLKERIKIKLREQDIDFFDYLGRFRPQPLLMKSRIMASGDPNYEQQVAFDDALLSTVGEELMEENLSADRFDYLLQQRAVRINGYKIEKLNEILDAKTT